MGYAPTVQGTTWTVSELLDEVRDLARIPSSNDYTDAKILAMANRAIAATMTELVMNNTALGGRLLDYQDVLVSDGFRSGKEFLVPNTSASGSLSHIEYYASDSDKPVKLALTTAVEATEIDSWDTENDEAPSHWYFKSGRIALVPVPENAGSTARVRIWFPRAHPKLVVTTNNVGTVSSVDQAANTITLAATHPSNWPAPTYAVDLYSAISPHWPLLSRLEITSDSGATLTYSPPTEGETDLSAADGNTKVAQTGTSDCVQLPDSMRDALTKRVCMPILRSLGDDARADKFWGESREELGIVQRQLAPRSKSSRPTIINRGSILRRRRRIW